MGSKNPLSSPTLSEIHETVEGALRAYESAAVARNELAARRQAETDQVNRSVPPPRSVDVEEQLPPRPGEVSAPLQWVAAELERLEGAAREVVRKIARAGLVKAGTNAAVHPAQEKDLAELVADAHLAFADFRAALFCLASALCEVGRPDETIALLAHIPAGHLNHELRRLSDRAQAVRARHALGAGNVDAASHFLSDVQLGPETGEFVFEAKLDVAIARTELLARRRNFAEAGRELAPLLRVAPSRIAQLPILQRRPELMWFMGAALEVVICDHRARVNAVAFSHDGALLGTLSSEGVCIWETATGVCLRTFSLSALDLVAKLDRLRFLKERLLLVYSVSSEEQPALYDIDNQRLLDLEGRAAPEPSFFQRDAVTSADGSLRIACDNQGQLEVMDVEGGKSAPYRIATTRVPVTLSASGTCIAACDCNVVRIYRIPIASARDVLHTTQPPWQRKG